MNKDYAELQLRLRRSGADTFAVEPQFREPGHEVFVEDEPGKVTFDLDALNEVLNDISAYGNQLTQSFFAHANVLSAFNSARTAVERVNGQLRVRLFIEASDSELHNLRWETLRDPRDGAWLLTSERILFSRYLRSPDWRSVRLRPRGEQRVLLVIANPRNLQDFAPEDKGRLQPVQVDVELELARAGLNELGAIQVESLASAGQASLSRIIEHLRKGFDILYLVCHGALVRERPRLYLEDDEGNVRVVDGGELASELAKLRQPPALVVLASCQSAGSGTKGALAAVGPRLGRAGVPAVLAMQGKITVQTSQQFMRRFFAELASDGQIDRAVAVARWAVREQPDAWMPVLFTRLISGQIWSTASETFERWPGLITCIRERRWTPILGPGLIEFLFDSPREIARRWADTYRFPMAPEDRADLPEVAQFLAIANADPQFPHAALENHLQREMRERYSAKLPTNLDGADLNTLITEVGRQQREQDETEPHRVLAKLPLPIYVTTNPDDLLAEALRAEGRRPETVLFRWNDMAEWPESVYDREPDYQPTAERPLVYHLFGQIKTRYSLVLTADNYFEYFAAITQLMAGKNPVTKNAVAIGNDIPRAVTTAWSQNALLFLGFQMDDWHFRVLSHSILKQEGSFRRRQYQFLRPNTAVQLDPDQASVLDPQRARKYLHDYFNIDYIKIYWGTAEEFIKELWREWQRSKQERK